MSNTDKDRGESGESKENSSINKGKHRWADGYVDKRHLIYLLSIAGGIIVVLLSIMFSESVYAGAMLSFAATLSSILLAVIAIIITLIDVAGQRSNIFDVKNSVDQLKRVSKDITVLTNEFEKRMQVRDAQMIALIEEVDSKNQDIVSKFDNLTNKLNDIKTSDDTQLIIEEVKDGLDFLKESLSAPNINESNKPVFKITPEIRIPGVRMGNNHTTLFAEEPEIDEYGRYVYKIKK